MNHIEKKWKGLLHKVNYLKFELDDRKEKFSKFESEIGDRLVQIDPEINAPPPAPSVSSVERNDEILDSKESDNINEKEANLETHDLENKKNELEPFKKLWKQIALKTHPDKNGGNEELSKAYRRALDAWNNGLVEDLLDIAIEIEIKISEPTQEMIDCLEKRANSMEDEIRKYESNVLWAWGHANEEKQSLIVDELLRYKRSKRKL